MASLHEITGEYLLLQNALESDVPEAVQDALARIGAVEDALEQKTLGVAFVLRNLQSEAATLEAEVQRMIDRLTRVRNRAEGLERYMLASLQLAEVTSVKGPTLTISVVQNPPAVIVDDESQIPAGYMVTPAPAPPPKPRPDKKAIADAFKRNGEIIPGTRVERGVRLKIS